MNRSGGFRIRVVSTVFTAALKVFTMITRRPRVRIRVLNEQGEILLLRGVISHGAWSLPGGGVGRKESLVAAAVRELYEETGIRIKETDMQFVRTLEKPAINIPFSAPLFETTVNRKKLPKVPHNTWEVMEIGWFRISHLPRPLSTIAESAIRELYDRGN